MWLMKVQSGGASHWLHTCYFCTCTWHVTNEKAIRWGFTRVASKRSRSDQKKNSKHIPPSDDPRKWIHSFQFAPYFRGLPPNRGFLAEKHQFAPYLPPIFLKNPLFFFNWVDLTTNFLIFCPSGTNLSQGDQAWFCKSVELNTEYWMVWQSFWIKLMKIYVQSIKEREKTGSPLFYVVMPAICPLF